MFEYETAVPTEEQIEAFPGGSRIEYLYGGMQILEDAPIILMSLDTQGYVTWLNNTWETLLGYSREECLHKPIARFVYFAEGVQANFEQLKPGVGNALKVHQLPLMSQSGDARPFEYAACHMGTAIYAYLSPVGQWLGYSSNGKATWGKERICGNLSKAYCRK